MQTDIVNTVTVLEYISPPPSPDIYREKAAVVRDNRTTQIEELWYLDFMTQITATETSPESLR